MCCVPALFIVIAAIHKKFTKILSCKRQKSSQLIIEGVNLQPFSLPTNWGANWKLNDRPNGIWFCHDLPDGGKQNNAAVRFRGRHRKTTFGENGKQSANFSRNSSVLHPWFLLFVGKATLRSRPRIFAEFLLRKRWTASASSAAFPLKNPWILPVLNGTFSGKNRPFTHAIRNEVKFKMITGIKKKNKLTEIWFDETDSAVNIRTYNTDLKNRLTAYAAKYPAHSKVQQTEHCAVLFCKGAGECAAHRGPPGPGWHGAPRLGAGADKRTLHAIKTSSKTLQNRFSGQTHKSSAAAVVDY